MADITRRALLSRAAVATGLVAGAGLGLTRGIHHKVAVPPPAPPSALTDALARQRRLLAGYDAVTSGSDRPALAALRSDVVAHGDALRALLERYPGWRLAQSNPSGSSASSASPGASASPGESADPAGSTVAQLATATAADVQALTTAVLAWPAAEPQAAAVVPTLASIAACLASHAQVLAA